MNCRHASISVSKICTFTLWTSFLRWVDNGQFNAMRGINVTESDVVGEVARSTRIALLGCSSDSSLLLSLRGNPRYLGSKHPRSPREANRRIHCSKFIAQLCTCKCIDWLAQQQSSPALCSTQRKHHPDYCPSRRCLFKQVVFEEEIHMPAHVKDIGRHFCSIIRPCEG